MVKNSKNMKKTVETFVKPVTGFIERFNNFMNKLETKTLEKEGVTEVDGFVTDLLDEVKDAEEGIQAFFTEILFMHHLTGKMTQIENEITLVEILGDRTRKFINPDFIEIFLKKEGEISSVYNYPFQRCFNPEILGEIARENFDKGESFLYRNKKIDRILYSLLAVPLRTTRERFGLIIIGKKSRKTFTSEETTLTIAGASVISFMISNIKLLQKIIKDKKMVTIGQTVAGLSHDIRNILNNLENGTYMLDLGVKNNDMQIVDHGREIIKRSYEKMKNLVLSMVDYSREREVEKTPVDLNRQIEDILFSYKEILAEKNIKVETYLDRKMPDILLDEYGIERMFTNLLQNAIDAVPAGKGKIEAGTDFSEKEKVVTISIKDNGPGISESSKDQIFDIFYSTKGSRGTGFGLAIVKKVVEEHSGTIDIQTDKKKGTVFQIKIPV
jgi:signal transduction histidine kinase